MNRKPDSRNTLTPAQKDKALNMRDAGQTWPQIADHFGRADAKTFAELVRKHEARTRGRDKLPTGRPRTLPPWTGEDHAVLVAMAPTGCGAKAIGDTLGRSLLSVRSRAGNYGIKIKRAADTWGVGGGNHPRDRMVQPPEAPYVSPDKLFADVSFAAPAGQQLRGVSKPTPTRGRLGLRPGRAAGGGMWSGGVVGGGDVA